MAPNPVVRRFQRAVQALGVGVFGDRLLLRVGLPALIARAIGMPKSLYRPHPYTLYELNPGWVSEDGRARHNSLGFRGPEIGSEKPQGRFRIVCMGESTTYCTGIENDDATYPAQLQAHLRRLRGDIDLEVINAGVGGYTSIENLLRFHFHVAPLRPDLVIYYYTHNDVHPRRMPGLSRDYREYSRSWYEPPFGGGLRGFFARRRALATGDIGNLVRRYDEYAGRRPSANVLTNAPNAFRANITALANLVQAAGSRLLFVNPPYRDLWTFHGGMGDGNPAYWAVFEHRNLIEEIGQKLNFPVFDLARRMPYPKDPHAFPNEHYLDFVHVNERGADLMGGLVAEAVVAEGLLPQR